MRRDLFKASLIGLPEAFGVGIPLALGLGAISPAWSGGVLLGLTAVAAGRLVGTLFLRALPRGGRVGLAAGLMGAARLFLMAGIAVGGICLGLPPLAVAAGLALPPLVLWAKVIILHKLPCQGS